MAAITWRNVDGPSLGEASGILSEAGKSLNAGLGVFDKMLQQREAVQAKNWEATKVNNTQAYMDALAAAKTPEELAALEKSGALTQMVDGFGGQVDKDKIRGAAVAQLNALRTQATATNQFNDQALARERAPILEQAAVLRSQGKHAEATALLNSGDYGVGEAAIHTGIKDDARKTLEQTRADEMFPIQRANEIAQGRLTGLNIDAATKVANDTALVQKTLGGHLDRFNSTNQQYSMGIASTAKMFKIPLNEYGMPDVEAPGLTAQQLEGFNTELKRAGLDKPPSSSSVMKQARADLIRAGASPAALAMADAQGNSVFKAKGALSVEDQAEVDKFNAVVDTKVADAAKNNLFYTPAKELVQAKTDVLSKVETLIKDGSMTKTSLREKITDWMDNGITITKAGKQVTVKVPPKVAEAALMGGLESDTWMDNDTDVNMKRIITDIMTSKDYDKQRAEAESLNADGHIIAKDQFVKKLKTNSGTDNAVDFMDNFNKTLTRAREAGNKSK